MSSLSNMLIKSDASLRHAMQMIDNNEAQICFVVDENQKLIGAVTDGDIRRALLKGVALEDPVNRFMNTSPKSVLEGTSMEQIIKQLNTWSVRQIPVVDEQGRICRVETIDGLVSLFRRPNRVVLMAGGFGKRLSPLTDHMPKPLLQVDGIPILEHILRRFKELGFRRFTISVNYKAEMIMSYFGDGSRLDIEIDYLHEDKPLGTCGALSLLKDKPVEPFFVMNGDLLTRADFSSILDYHVEQNSLVTMCVREHSFEVPYGVVRLDRNKIISIEEKPKEVNFINAGIYVLSPEVLKSIPDAQFLDMPTLLMNLRKQDRSLTAYVLRDYWLDIGRMEDFQRAQTEYEKHYKL